MAYPRVIYNLNGNHPKYENGFFGLRMAGGGIN